MGWRAKFKASAGRILCMPGLDEEKLTMTKCVNCELDGTVFRKPIGVNLNQSFVDCQFGRPTDSERRVQTRNRCHKYIRHSAYHGFERA